MKHLKKNIRKRTVEAYACSGCGNPSDCVSGCAGDISRFDTSAYGYAQGTINEGN